MIEMINHNFIINPQGELVNWVHLENPTEQEIQEILLKYPMPRDFITGGTDVDEPSRYEQQFQENGNELDLFVFSYPFFDEQKNRMNNYYTLPISIVLSDDFIITTTMKHHNLINQIKRPPDLSPQLSINSWLMRTFWIISREYINQLKLIKNKLTEIEYQVSSSTENTILYDLVGLNKGLIYFETAIQGNSRILKTIENETEEYGFSAKQSEMLRDVQIEHFQALTLVMKLKEMIEKLSDMLSNIINNNMNQVMKRLTAWTILLTVPTITSAIWGMNVDLPFDRSPQGFIIVMALTAILTYYVYRWLKNSQNM